MMSQIRVLRAVSGMRTYAGTWVLGEPGRAVRGQTIDGGASQPIGSTSFLVPAGTVRIQDVLRFRKQHFRVTGIEPLPPFYLKERVTTEQVAGSFPEA